MLPWIKRRIGPFGRFDKNVNVHRKSRSGNHTSPRIHARYQAGHLTHQDKLCSMTLTIWPKTLVITHPTILSIRIPKSQKFESRKGHLLALCFCFLGVFFGVLLPFLGVHVVGFNLFFEGEKTLASPPPPSSNDKFLLTP